MATKQEFNDFKNKIEKELNMLKSFHTKEIKEYMKN